MSIGRARAAVARAIQQEVGSTTPLGEALLELFDASSSIFSLVGANGVLFRPGAPSTDTHVATWAEVKQRIAATEGMLAVYVDNSLAPAHVLASDGITDCRGRVELRPFAARTVADAELIIDDGAQLKDVARITGPLIVAGQCVTVAAFAFSDNQEFFLRDGAELQLLAGAAQQMMSVLAGNVLTIDADNEVVFDNSAVPAVPVVDALGTGALVLVLGNKVILNGANWFAGGAAASLAVNRDATVSALALATFAGTITDTKIDRIENAQGLVVANVAAMAALDTTRFSDGLPCYVQTQKQRYLLRKGSGATAEANYIVAGTGTDRWERQTVPVPESVYQTAWFVDGTNGSDENDGLTVGTPLQHIEEWYRRTQGQYASLCTLTIVNPTADEHFDYVVQSLTNTKPDGFNNVFIVKGTPTVLATDTIAAASAQTTAARGQTTLTTNNVAGFLGQWLLMTSGAASGAFAPIMQIAGDGAKQFSAPGYYIPQPTLALFAAGIKPAPAPGDTCSIVSLPSIRVMPVRPSNGELIFQNLILTGPLNTSGIDVTGSNRTMGFQSCDVTTLDGGAGNFIGCYFSIVSAGNCWTPGGADADNVAAILNYYFCSFSAGVIFGGPQLHQLLGCLFKAAVSVGTITPGGAAEVYGLFGILGGGTGVFGQINLDMGGKLALTTAGGSGPCGLFGAAGVAVGTAINRGGQMFLNGVTPTFTGTVQDLQIDGVDNHLPNIEASAGLVLPAAAPATSYAQVAAAPYNGNAMSYKTGAGVFA